MAAVYHRLLFPSVQRKDITADARVFRDVNVFFNLHAPFCGNYA
jgi:hypothetical protein